MDEENDKKAAHSRCKMQAGGNSAPLTLRTSSPHSLGESSECQPDGQAKIGSIIIIATTSTNSTFAATNIAIAIHHHYYQQQHRGYLYAVAIAMTNVSFTWIVLIVVTLLMRACFMFFQMALFSCLPRHQPEPSATISSNRVRIPPICNSYLHLF